WWFFARSALLWFAIVLTPTWLLRSIGQGIAAQAVFVALMLLTPRYRLRAADDGLHVRFLFVSTLIPIADIERVSVGLDPRRGVIGRRGDVLEIVRRGRAPLLVLAPAEALRSLAGELAATAGLDGGRR